VFKLFREAVFYRDKDIGRLEVPLVRCFRESWRLMVLEPIISLVRSFIEWQKRLGKSLDSGGFGVRSTLFTVVIHKKESWPII
jgi:hypothetical protein